MRHLAYLAPLFVLGAMNLAVKVSTAGEPSPAPPSSTNELLLQRLEEATRRLEAAEARIRALEEERDHAREAYPFVSINQEKTEEAKEDKSSYAAEVKKIISEWDKKKSDEAKKITEAESSKRPTIGFAGRIHYDNTYYPTTSPGIGFIENPASGNDPSNRLHFRRLRVTTRGTIPYNSMIYKLDFEFADPNNGQIRDAFIGFTKLPYLQTLLIGNQKRFLTLDQYNSSNVNVFMERPLVADGFDEETRRLGIASYGHSEDYTFNWAYGFYNLKIVQSDGNYLGDPYQGSGNIRFCVMPWYDEATGGRGYLHLGVTNMIAHPDGNPATGDPQSNEARFRARPELRSSERWWNTGRIANADWFDTYGVQGVLNLGPLQIAGEYLGTQVWRDNNSPNVFFSGGYIYVAYFLTGEHQAWRRDRAVLGRVKPFEPFFCVRRCDGCRDTGWGAWQVAVRYSYLDLNDQDIFGGDGGITTFALNWWWTERARFMVNYSIGDIKNRLIDGDDAIAPGLYSGNFTGLAARMQIDW